MAKINLSADEMNILERSIDLLNNKIAQHIELAGELENRVIDYSLGNRACQACSGTCKISCHSGCEGDCAGSCEDSCKTGCKTTCHTGYWLPG